MFKGAGFENTNNYKNTKIYFNDIENIHYVRNCFYKMQSITSDTFIKQNKKVYSNIESTGWYNQISIILEKSYDIYYSMKVSLK